MGKENLAECYLKSSLKQWFLKETESDAFEPIPPAMCIVLISRLF